MRKKKIKLCNEYCKGCFHYAENINACLFILDIGKCRPCPAGTGCCVKQEGNRKYTSDEYLYPPEPKTPILPFNWWKEHADEE